MRLMQTMLDVTSVNPPRLSLSAVLRELVATSTDQAPQDTDFDARVRAAIAGATRGLSPMAIIEAYVDWLGHLALSPGKVATLSKSAVSKALALGLYGASQALGASAPALAAADDPRLTGERWQVFPFSVLAQGFTLARDLIEEATTNVRGTRPEHGELVAFLSGQILELLSPANFPLTNPDVLAATRDERGANIVRGLAHLKDDMMGRSRPADFVVGRDVAVTPGKVVYQNELIELIQYDAATETVGAEPVLIVPAWIMKYYILDLSPSNSLVRYLRDRGKTVFAISWKNPTSSDADLCMDDYLRRGVMQALDAATAITGSSTVHGVGYCLGGTLLSIAAAAMARDGDTRLKTMTSFASQLDFREAGEIRMFLGESAQSFLGPMMAEKGYLDIDSMVGAFKSLRASAQIYGPAVSRYCLGEAPPHSDLMAWNTDGTRLPQRMHREYLRQCYLNNDLAEARYCVDGKPVCVGDISVPTFILATLTDHVAPWRSVYKAVRLMHNDLTFALTTAGHNAGIVSGPSHPRRRYQIARRKACAAYIDPDTWHAQTPCHDGSWWPAWDAWLDTHMGPQRTPPAMGAAAQAYVVLRDAPGDYVFG